MNLADRLGTLPRAARWALAAGVGLAAYFLVVEPVLEWKVAIDARAGRVAARLESFRRAAGSRQAASEAIDVGVRRVSTVAFPDDQAARSQAFSRRIDEAFERHGIRDRTTRTRTSSLPTGPLQPLIPAHSRLDRLIADIQFTAPPEKVTALLAELEQTPEVAAVSQLSLEKPTGERGSSERVLSVTLSVEAWVLARKEAR